MRDLVVYGLGELGQLFGAGALRAGYRVTPITRQVDPSAALGGLGSEVPILVAVGETALDEVLSELARAQRGGAIILLQNELFPSCWRRHGMNPTVLVPWLLKKRGQPLAIARPTAVYGPQARLVCELHEALALPAESLADERALQAALVAKYAFILTVNALGLLRDRTLAMWLQEDPLRVRALAQEGALLGARLCEIEPDPAASAHTVEEAMRALGATGARGRSAQARIARALGHAERLGLSLPELTRTLAQAHAT